MNDTQKILDRICTRKPNKTYRNQKEQIYLALYYYLIYHDNSLFYNSIDRQKITNLSPFLLKSLLIKNIITVYHMKKDASLNTITHVNKHPIDFNEEELEFSISTMFEKGGIQAVDIYINTFQDLPMKCIKHFISSRYLPKKINKESINQYIETHDQLNFAFRAIDRYYQNLTTFENKKK